MKALAKVGFSDELFMNEALNEAKKALKIAEVPVGAVIVKDQKIIARGYNKKESKNDATFHAEICAIKNASKRLSSWRLNHCDMYVTLEPCAMCAGALIQARIKRLYFGTFDKKAGAVGSVIDLTKVAEFNHHIEVISGVLEDECMQILKDFFSSLRKK